MMTSWTDSLFKALPAPNEVGSTEYLAVYELVMGAMRVALNSASPPADMVDASLTSLSEEIGRVRDIIATL